MASSPIKIRKGKNGNTFYCRLWNGEKQNTQTITLGKETKDFTLTQASLKYEFIKDLFKQKKWNYEDYLKEDEKKQTINKDKNELTFKKVFYKHFEKKLIEKKDEFVRYYKNQINITKDDLKTNPQWKKKLTAWNGKKNNYENYLLAKSYHLENIPKKDGTPSKRFKKNGVKEYEDLADKLFVDVNKEDIEYIDRKLKNTKYKGKYLEQKTIINVLNQFKTIIAWGIEEYELDIKNPFFKFKREERKRLLKDDKLRRERILTESELSWFFNTLYLEKNKNAFIGALLGYTFASRSETVLNIRKIDFEPIFDENEEYYYNNVKLMNMKTHKFYTCPVPKNIGKFLYQYLLDYDLEEYVLRPKREGSRPKIPVPLRQISEDYYKTADILFFYTEDILSLRNSINTKNEALLILRKDYLKNRVKNTDLAKERKEQIDYIVKEKEYIEEVFKENIARLKSNRDYVRKKHFDFHSLRHQMASEMSKHNFQYTKFLLSHSEQSIREDEVSLRYSKIDFDDLREKMEIVNKNIYINVLQQSAEMELYNLQKISHKDNYEKYKHKINNPLSVENFNVKNLTQDFASKILEDKLSGKEIRTNINNDKHLYTNEKTKMENYHQEDLDLEKQKRQEIKKLKEEALKIKMEYEEKLRNIDKIKENVKEEQKTNELLRPEMPFIPDPY